MSGRRRDGLRHGVETPMQGSSQCGMVLSLEVV